MTDTKVLFLVESLLEVLNERWKVDSIESGHSFYHQLTYSVGKRYIKLISNYVSDSNHRSVYMFVDKETGECYKPSSWTQPAKGVRFTIEQLVESPETCDPYGSFLYIR